MRFVIFTHSLRSCWNHGNAHFLRGLARDLRRRGHSVSVFEPEGAWSAENLVRDQGPSALGAYRTAYPELAATTYGSEFDPAEATDGADVVLVHEWNDPTLVARLGQVRRRGAPFRLLFHDTHHRAATDPKTMAGQDLSAYDGVLAFGEVIRERYLRAGWARRVWTFHEAADTTVFRPLIADRTADLVWIGNFGDGERTAELHSMLIDPVHELGLSATVHGVRYPDSVRASLRDAGMSYAGWLPNHEVPQVFARHRMTVHVPRRPYVEALPGIPTIRVFEALACAIPLVCADFHDAEGLFSPGRDYLVARDRGEMKKHLRALSQDDAYARSFADHGLRTILARHTVAHRGSQLLDICAELGREEALAS